ncbi:phenylacetate-CoA ligase [Pseudobutyrivibrio ruminis]|uniref:Phenylacetate-CoA ligase n=1 Tax=Pseudobutyrivibrio ruminis TaxID=46206 RepID=A0A1H7KAN5_9FIRM|nr:hypothetical protein [Pseudobutyrivibrio ruminis]SEK82985.1 phenylacetate-CoA ligase [Pseudobutyrivibrio ruminis]
MDREEKYNAFVKDDIENNRGRLVSSCEELDYLLAHPEANEILSKHYLNEILTYATTFSNYYKEYKNYRSIKDFPILNKQDLKDHWNDIEIEEYNCMTDNCTKYTSGSTGTPFKMVMDRYKHSRWIAGNKVFRANVGVKSHEKTVFISETVQDKKIPMERQERDNVYYLSCKYFDDNSLLGLLSYLRDNDIKSLTALASLLDKLAHLINEGLAPKWDGELIAIFSVSEHLKETTRKIIEKYFNCPVYVFYANEENGVLGVEDGTQFGCRANEADFYFEVLKIDSDEPCEEGELGRLIITDLFNKAFPIIRYENGDLVSMKRNPDGKLYITNIAGRKTDALYTTDGRMVHYFNSISFLEPYMDIKQFQLIQYSLKKFKWVLNTGNKEYEEMIIQESKALFGEDSEWEIEYVDEIPKLKSGKTQMTVCKIMK